MNEPGLVEQFQQFYRQYTMRFWIYVLLTVSFAVFFSIILMNQNSRYSIRLEQSQNRISTRMQMMRDSYLSTDSVFRHEVDSLRRLDSMGIEHK